jgi:hypothetical protein
MDLDTKIIAVFCRIDDALKRLFQGQRLRRSGPEPLLSDSEVLSMEAVGEFLGLSRDTALYRYFRQHYSHFFPAMAQVCRTTFVRQAANLWRVKEQVWQILLGSIRYDPALAIVDSFPLPVCRFARAHRCQRFRGEAAFGRDDVARQTFYGFRVHLRLNWPGLITGFGLAPANVHDLAMVPELVADTQGVLLGDRNYWSPTLSEELRGQGLTLLAPFKSKKKDPWPRRSYQLSRPRYRIETVFSQLVERFQAKQVWARDIWHLQARLLRKVLSHTLAFSLNQEQGNPPLQFDKLLAW